MSKQQLMKHDTLIKKCYICMVYYKTKSIKNTINETGYKRDFINKTLNFFNIKRFDCDKRLTVPDKNIIDLYLSGLSGLEISEKTGTNKATVYFHLEHSGINMRTSKEIYALSKKRGRLKTGDKSPMWKGGNNNGYKWIYHNGKRHPEQNIIMENHIGRPVKKVEVVHHKNLNRKDNRIENLQLMTRSEHSKLHNPKGKKLKPETIEKMKKRMAGKYQKEEHWQWRDDLTKEKLIDALSKTKNKSEAAKLLDVHLATVIDREKYYGIFKKPAYDLTEEKILSALRKSKTLKEAFLFLKVNSLTLKRRMDKYGINYKKELKK